MLMLRNLHYNSGSLVYANLHKGLCSFSLISSNHDVPELKSTAIILQKCYRLIPASLEWIRTGNLTKYYHFEPCVFSHCGSDIVWFQLLVSCRFFLRRGISFKYVISMLNHVTVFFQTIEKFIHVIYSCCVYLRNSNKCNYKLSLKLQFVKLHFFWFKISSITLAINYLVFSTLE